MDYTIPEQPHYSVQCNNSEILNVNGKSHTFYFQKWEGSPEGSVTFDDNYSAETALMFNQDGATVETLMKAAELADNDETFTASSNKITKLSDGTFVRVYESMGHVWVEYSSDGVNWQLGNNHSPVNDITLNAKNPSIARDLNSTNALIVYQEGLNNNVYSIKAAFYRPSVDAILDTDILRTVTYKDYIDDAQPVIVRSNSRLMVVWSEKDPSSEWDVDGGLYYCLGERHVPPVSGNYMSWGTFAGPVTGTDENSSNPVVASSYITQVECVHLAWQQGNTAIKYSFTDPVQLSAGNVSWSSCETPSDGVGYTANRFPSMIVLEDEAPRLVWIGEKDNSGIAIRMLKSDIISCDNEIRVVLRGRPCSGGDPYTGYWNSTFFKFGGCVQDAKINRTYETPARYKFAWNDDPDDYKKYLTSLSFSTILYYQIYGEGIDLSDAETFNEIEAISLNTDSAPYEIECSATSLPPEKIQTVSASTGREGSIYTDNAQFWFAIADINIDGEMVTFSELDEFFTFSGLEGLNDNLESNVFAVNDNSELTFSIDYGTMDTATAAQTLADGKYVRFKAELIDATTDEILGVYDDITFNSSNYSNYKNEGYLLNTDGIGNREVKFRLVVEDNLGANYAMAQILAEEEIIAKSNITNISYQGDLKVETYDLSQNFPSPFNPETVIKYQIPEAGHVTIKVYDMLGREVATLVNETQKEGRYEIKFTAGRFASGVYTKVKINMVQLLHSD